LSAVGFTALLLSLGLLKLRFSGFVTSLVPLPYTLYKNSLCKYRCGREKLIFCIRTNHADVYFSCIHTGIPTSLPISWFEVYADYLISNSAFAKRFLATCVCPEAGHLNRGSSWFHLYKFIDSEPVNPQLFEVPQQQKEAEMEEKNWGK
jgi:hypothetical protein